MIDLFEPNKYIESDIQPIPLEYKEINKNSRNILLIDNLVYQNEVLFNSSNSNTFGIKYSINSDRDELNKILGDNFESIDRIGFVFNDALIESKQFLNSELFFTSKDLEPETNIFSSNLTFIIELVKKFNIKNIDFLVCNGLNYSNWTKYFNLLTKQTGIIIGASNDKTGNIKYGGDWILESTGTDIKNIYWNDNINDYTSTLFTSTISTSTTITNLYLSSVGWPITINGGTKSNPTIVTFGEDISLNSTSNYFVIGSEYVIIEGNNKTVTIDKVHDYPGLFQNGGDNVSGYSNITINDINLDTISSGVITTTLISRGGWLCQTYFANSASNCFLNNLSSSGKMFNDRTGGIVGRLCATNYGNLVIINCYSTGEISGLIAGGICGSGAGSTNGTIIIKDCYSTGLVSGKQAGGICGASAGSTNGTVAITNCYSTGNITSESAGGICGFNAGNTYGTIAITNCYSTGLISGIQAGGICGTSAGSTNGTVAIKDCYSTGLINGIQAGGICGSSTGYTNGTVAITNCYSTGNISSVSAGGICGIGTGTTFGLVTITNCYSTGNVSDENSGGICGSFTGSNSGVVRIKDCYSTGLISGNSSGGICGSSTGYTNGTITIINCYSTGNIDGDYSGGITGDAFGFNSSNLNTIENCYSTGNITGINSGGICGALVGYNNSISYTPNILISNCYTLGTVTNDSGSICGGNEPNSPYTNIPNVNIKNCYSLYGPIVSTTLSFTPTQTDTFVQNGSWTDANAYIYLLLTPTYNANGILINPIGTIWADIDPISNSTPWIFSTFGYSPYTTELIVTFIQKVLVGNKSSQALDISNHVYSIIAINNEIPSKYQTISMNSSTGQITVGLSTQIGTYSIKVLQHSNYTMTNFELIVSKSPNNNRCTEFCMTIKENKKIIIKLNSIYSNNCLIEKYKIIKNPKHGCVSINSKNELTYIPDKNYVGKDNFVLRCKNIISGLSTYISFNIKIVKCKNI